VNPPFGASEVMNGRCSQSYFKVIPLPYISIEMLFRVDRVMKLPYEVNPIPLRAYLLMVRKNYYLIQTLIWFLEAIRKYFYFIFILTTKSRYHIHGNDAALA
jgi:hypothetical protein